ncbi:phage virion morphogenesis protein [Serratia sp. JSRIV001]|uniref:phage virion morphogenesis protein n=2 Tax=unclassified Serratia (in: enterobacteria) TaxID=2647522 RepID=UPI001CBE96A4|nr:phage virion morphogenesis protein [Serratia sp. JSRIV001]UAN47013.1 phage virion morphogenesis protein [Serratia sp. JSRIV001]UAN55453.1 phage virion morphogenesis protein [Serratia sp. JSRIV004]UAN57266.1 phage virion morphogenesis protein [Serratia sp. JSRIV004]
MMDIKIDLTAYNTTLGKLIRSTTQRHDLMTALAGTLLDVVETNFQHEGRPKWMGWSPAYARQRGSGQILQKSGRLAASIRAAVTNDDATVGTNVRYARIHNEGGEIKHSAKSQNLYFKQYKNGSVSRQFVKKRNSNFVQSATVGAYTVKMPARPFLQIVDSDITDLEDTANRYFARVID